ncbi:hypothetical protein DFP72DRAFT_1098193 [Ephemerocybe angulata]|uniref:UBX domain-containing protein n=1 Tax=Ephemerocybe angulata TaxID=980116 RepID=A0A8H6LWH7_9AGAR|nr:hypothetical protein DFP72DRAFT_1098193 [Tulosesus angulatus]
MAIGIMASRFQPIVLHGMVMGERVLRVGGESLAGLRWTHRGARYDSVRPSNRSESVRRCTRLAYRKIVSFASISIALVMPARPVFTRPGLWTDIDYRLPSNVVLHRRGWYRCGILEHDSHCNSTVPSREREADEAECYLCVYECLHESSRLPPLSHPSVIWTPSISWVPIRGQQDVLVLRSWPTFFTDSSARFDSLSCGEWVRRNDRGCERPGCSISINLEEFKCTASSRRSSLPAPHPLQLVRAQANTHTGEAPASKFDVSLHPAPSMTNGPKNNNWELEFDFEPVPLTARSSALSFAASTAVNDESTPETTHYAASSSRQNTKGHSHRRSNSIFEGLETLWVEEVRDWGTNHNARAHSSGPCARSKNAPSPQEEEEEVRRAEKRMAWRRWTRWSFPQADADAGKALSLAIRLPTGQRLVHTFAAFADLADPYAYTDKNLFSLRLPRPRLLSRNPSLKHISRQLKA